jgi:hypothetical protein
LKKGDMPIDPQEDPPIKPGKPTEPPQESPPGNPQPEVPPPMQDPGEPPRPEELPGHVPDELPVRGPPPGPPGPTAATYGGSSRVRNSRASGTPQGIFVKAGFKRWSECAMNEDASCLSNARNIYEAAFVGCHNPA